MLSDRADRRRDLGRPGLILEVNQAPKDQDADGLRNRGEFREGTDPRDPDGAEDGEASECHGKPHPKPGEGPPPPPAEEDGE